MSNEDVHGEDEENFLCNLVGRNFLIDLLEYRKHNTEMCNMTLLLLIVWKNHDSYIKMSIFLSIFIL